MAVLDYIIPGYKGYRERTEGRATDRAFRDYMASKLKEVHDRLERVKFSITSDFSKIALLNDAEQATLLLTKVRDRMRWSNQGFAGTLTGSVAETEAIKAIEQFDQSLEQHRNTVETAINNIENQFAGGGDMKPAFFHLTSALRQMDSHMNEREALLRKTIG
ncbi:hypothetical protein KKF34_08270 [Myxococcota bacterium]|nr:hypothetical protein [Myxococcota bacterium]MBU1381599.1 hypothetical protein [Myxococcota bacterium]MBU1496857.1 hypothetical protein [Myxococcota bacterium]